MHSQNRNISLRSKRGVAQPGSAPGLGPGGRRFESCRPDKKRHITMCLFFLFYYYPVNFFIYGFREAGPLYEPHCKPPCGAAMRGQGHEEQFPRRRLMLLHLIKIRKPRFAERTPVHTHAPQLRRKAACSGLRIEAGPLARTVRINSHHGRTCTA